MSVSCYYLQLGWGSKRCPVASPMQTLAWRKLVILSDLITGTFSKGKLLLLGFSSVGRKQSSAQRYFLTSKVTSRGFVSDLIYFSWRPRHSWTRSSSTFERTLSNNLGTLSVPSVCITELTHNKTSIVNDSARLVMSSGQLALSLKCLFNPISCLWDKEPANHFLCCWFNMDFLVNTPINWPSGQTNKHKMVTQVIMGVWPGNPRLYYVLEAFLRLQLQSLGM